MLSGAILCFLPDWQDIKAVQEKLAAKPRFSSGSQRILPCKPMKKIGFRRIQIVQRILTLFPPLFFVSQCTPVCRWQTSRWCSSAPQRAAAGHGVSQSNVTQRKGRAGRCQPGQAYHLFPRKQLESMSPFPIPEILRTPLESLVVQAKIYSATCKVLRVFILFKSSFFFKLSIIVVDAPGLIFACRL